MQVIFMPTKTLLLILALVLILIMLEIMFTPSIAQINNNLLLNQYFFLL
ncbi:hypothetical protein GCWU000324_02409 [Kingella oralis ATCC 51147]|uniref:Uncharacterized protein n=1 Tax=Kingella oralis ATCC 51147 TaxID=629741 RepID=C4GK35_9NEIS|nr:hypothetical protein GCWU000324_02409 [Kingella oralis ATCC 51147]